MQFFSHSGRGCEEQNAASKNSANVLVFSRLTGTGFFPSVQKHPSDPRSSAIFSKRPFLWKKVLLTGSRCRAAVIPWRAWKTSSNMQFCPTAAHCSDGGSCSAPSMSDRRDRSPLNPLQVLKAEWLLGLSSILKSDYKCWKERKKKALKEALEYLKIASLHKNSFTKFSLFEGRGEGGQNKAHHCTASPPFPHIPNESHNQPLNAPLGATKAASLTGTEQCSQEGAKKSNVLFYKS